MNKEWIIIANPKVYNHRESFLANGHIDWKQDVNFSVGDIVFVFVAGNEYDTQTSEIKYMCRVDKINITKKDPDWTNDEYFWIKKIMYFKSLNGSFVRLTNIKTTVDNETKLSLSILFKKGLNFYPKGGAKQITSLELSHYIHSIFNSESSSNTSFETRNIPINVRNIVLKRDKCACKVCGSNKNIHLDHIIPYSKGGTSTNPDNIQVLCQECNLKKSNKII